MLISSLLLIPLIGISLILIIPNYINEGNKVAINTSIDTDRSVYTSVKESNSTALYSVNKPHLIKSIALLTSIFNLFVSVILFLLFNFSSNQFQFVQEHYSINNFDFYLGVDGISIYFVLLTTIIIPIALLSN